MNYNSLPGYIISDLYEFYIISRISALVRLIIQCNLIFVSGNVQRKGKYFLIYCDCFHFLSLQFSSVTQSCPTLCDPMNCSTPGLPVHHQLPESTQTHVHCVGDAIQSSRPLSSSSPPALNLSQDQGLFK